VQAGLGVAAGHEDGVPQELQGAAVVGRGPRGRSWRGCKTGFLRRTRDSSSWKGNTVKCVARKVVKKEHAQRRYLGSSSRGICALENRITVELLIAHNLLEPVS
jgi:hypothetical protein